MSDSGHRQEPQPVAQDEPLWFVRRQGEVRGPFPANRVARYMLLGRISRDDEISRDRQSWHSVGSVPHLIPDLLQEATLHPTDPVSQDHLAAARRWNGNASKRRHVPRAVPGGAGYALVLMIAVSIVVVALLLPEPVAMQEPDCTARPAPGVVWRNCPLAGSELANADLAGAELRSADLRGSVLRAANLAGADLSYANLRLAKLRGANLRDARLIGADLRGSDLRRTDLKGADLAYADLTGADLAGADLSDATLDHAIWAEGVVCLPGSVGGCRRAAR